MTSCVLGWGEVGIVGRILPSAVGKICRRFLQSFCVPHVIWTSVTVMATPAGLDWGSNPLLVKFSALEVF